MELKDDDIIEFELTVEPQSCFSHALKKSFSRHFGNNLQIIVDCPNGSCTEGKITISDFRIRDSAREAVASGGDRFVISTDCDGWEDKERRKHFRCGSRLTLVAHIRFVQRTAAGA